ncbi:hypothetical protein PFISCL1PPCAC_372, partial [Pristionchus fissidentatus]
AIAGTIMDSAPPQDELMENQYEIVSDDLENAEEEKLMDGIGDEEEVEREPIWDVDYSFDSDDEASVVPLGKIEVIMLNVAFIMLERKPSSERIIQIVEKRENREISRNLSYEDNEICVKELQPKTQHELMAFVKALQKANGGELPRTIPKCNALNDDISAELVRGVKYTFNEEDEESKEPMTEIEKKQLYFELALIHQWDTIHTIIEKRSNPQSERFVRYEEWRELDMMTFRELNKFKYAIKNLVARGTEELEKNADDEQKTQEMKDALEDKDYSFDSDDEDNQIPMNYIERMKLGQQSKDVGDGYLRTSLIIKTREGVDTHFTVDQVHHHMLQPKTVREIEAFYDSEQAKKGIVNSRELTKEISTKKFTSEDAKDYFFDSDDENNEEPMTDEQSESLSWSYEFLPWQSIARAHHIIESRENVEVDVEKGFFPPTEIIRLFNDEHIAAFRNLQPKTQWELRAYIESEIEKSKKAERLKKRRAAGLPDTAGEKVSPAAPEGAAEELSSYFSNSTCTIN